MQQMDEAYRLLLQEAYERFLKCLNSQPGEAPLPYDFDFLMNRKWHLLGETLVSSDLNELTNLLNRWQFALLRWDTWNQVLSSYDEDTAWLLRYEFLDPLAHECLLRPSALRDTFTSVATKALHQVKLSIDSAYRDHLPGDPASPSDRPKPLNRRQKEAHLHTIARTWADGKTLLGAIRTLNSQTYKDATADYRNRVNHGIGPRLGVGETCLVTRQVAHAERMEQQADGSFMLVTIPNKMSVRYGFGGTPPLDLIAAYQANERQFRLARDCYGQFLSFLKKVVAEIEPQIETEILANQSPD
jgi:hypothetical protein